MAKSLFTFSKEHGLDLIYCFLPRLSPPDLTMHLREVWTEAKSALKFCILPPLPHLSDPIKCEELDL